MIDLARTKELFETIEGAHSSTIEHFDDQWTYFIKDRGGNVLFTKDSLGYERRYKYDANEVRVWAEDNVGYYSADDIAADEIAADEACRGREREPSMEERMTKLELTLDTILALLQGK